MASKITYWKCVDCNSMINDQNMHYIGEGTDLKYLTQSWKPEVPKYAEFCYGCMSYNPEVVIAYR